MDGYKARKNVFVVAATSDLTNVAVGLRRPGRFDREVAIRMPTLQERCEILVTLGIADPAAIASVTNGCGVGTLMRMVRDGTCEVGLDECGWDGIGGVSEVKRKLRVVVEWPLMYADVFERLGVTPCRGVLLYGPPGCSKTSMVRVLARTVGVAFFTMSGAEIYSALLGESERLLRDVFRKARESTPAILFLDEIDTIVGMRGRDGVQDRVLATLLNEMDGIEDGGGVIVIGATNRPDLVDSALLRGGRFEKVLYVGVPDYEARIEILRIHGGSDVDYSIVAELTEGFSGADLKGVCREAGMVGVRTGRSVGKKEFEDAVGRVRGSISLEMRKLYEEFLKTFGT